jgi:hypothetical protein
MQFGMYMMLSAIMFRLRISVRQYVQPPGARSRAAGWRRWWDEYINSQRKVARAAADAGATVILSNHSEYDHAYTKARLIAAPRQPGENHPFVVGADAVQRYFIVMAECAAASKLRAAAK